jgi:hypothetical protein
MSCSKISCICNKGVDLRVKIFSSTTKSYWQYPQVIVLCAIRHLYSAFRHGIDAAPTAFYASTPSFSPYPQNSFVSFVRYPWSSSGSASLRSLCKPTPSGFFIGYHMMAASPMGSLRSPNSILALYSNSLPILLPSARDTTVTQADHILHTGTPGPPLPSPSTARLSGIRDHSKLPSILMYVMGRSPQSVSSTADIAGNTAQPNDPQHVLRHVRTPHHTTSLGHADIMILCLISFLMGFIRMGRTPVNLDAALVGRASNIKF